MGRILEKRLAFGASPGRTIVEGLCSGSMLRTPQGGLENSAYFRKVHYSGRYPAHRADVYVSGIGLTGGTGQGHRGGCMIDRRWWLTQWT